MSSEEEGEERREGLPGGSAWVLCMLWHPSRAGFEQGSKKSVGEKHQTPRASDQADLMVLMALVQGS